MGGLEYIARLILKTLNVIRTVLHLLPNSHSHVVADVPLLQRSLKLWYELHDFYNVELDGEDSPYGKNVLTMSGGIMIGRWIFIS